MSEVDQLSRNAASTVSSETEYLPILDGWRAVAILLVLIFHGLFNTDTTGKRSLAALAALSGKAGALGVLIFFCISGFLITKKLLGESRSRGNFSIQAFYVKRFFRIIPPLATYLLVILTLFAFGVLSLKVGDWSAPLFLTNYLPGSWYTAHFWSLSVEEHFYLFWPACILILGWRRSMWAGVAIVLAVGIWRPWELHHVLRQARALQHTDMRLDYIMMGCIVALASTFYRSAARTLKVLGSALGIASLLCALILSARPWAVDTRSLQAALLTLMVCGSAMANSRFLMILLANPVMLFIGRISYSLYIWQELFLGPTSQPFLHSTSALLLIKFPAVVAVSFLSYHFVEKPFIAYGRRLLKRSTSRQENLKLNRCA